MHQHGSEHIEHLKSEKAEEDNINKQKKAVTFDANQNSKKSPGQAKNNLSHSQSKKANATASSTVKPQ